MQFHGMHPFPLRELSETIPNALRLTVYAPSLAPSLLISDRV